VQYLDGLLARAKHHQEESDSVYEAFSDFADTSGYGGFVPSSSWLRMMYVYFIKDHREEIDQRCAMGSAKICSIDHSHKVCWLMDII